MGLSLHKKIGLYLEFFNLVSWIFLIHWFTRLKMCRLLVAWIMKINTCQFCWQKVFPQAFLCFYIRALCLRAIFCQVWYGYVYCLWLMLMYHFVIEAIAEQLKELQRTLNRNITQVSIFKEMYPQDEKRFYRKQISHWTNNP